MSRDGRTTPGNPPIRLGSSVVMGKTSAGVCSFRNRRRFWTCRGTQVSLADTEGTHGTPESLDLFRFTFAFLVSEPSPLVESSIGGGSLAFGCHLNPHGLVCNRRRFRSCKGTTPESMDDRFRFHLGFLSSELSPVFESSIGGGPLALGFHWNPRTSCTRRRYSSSFVGLRSRSSCSSFCPIRVPGYLEPDIQDFERKKERKESTAYECANVKSLAISMINERE